MFECGGMIDIGKDLQDAFDDGYRQAMQDRWIPVSERLPEKDGMYLITSDILGKMEVQYVFFQPNIPLFICNGKPIAWKPLPEPYKELATDNNVVTKSGKDNNVLTIGDKIRESNRSLAYMLGSLCSHGTTDIKTFEMRGWTTKKWLDYLNQPYME